MGRQTDPLIEMKVRIKNLLFFSGSIVIALITPNKVEITHPVLIRYAKSGKKDQHRGNSDTCRNYPTNKNVNKTKTNWFQKKWLTFFRNWI